ncbi:hypothetical protein ACCO45_011177 [Purpureocillium lilacinum]|uniref:Uncharacterized protein n=1 Tax=Purpureocillium lilacinum TaxID=33203 RepID=A0ACC4DID0_PURLI
MYRGAVLVSVAGLAQLASAGLYPGITTDNHTCALVDPVLSCSCKATPDKVADTCCTETYGGLLVATQIWNTFTGLESKGQIYPKNHWTIHGLWPARAQHHRRHPHGTPVPPYTGEPIDKWFKPYGKLDLLAYMNKYWVSQYDPNWVFWAHEFSKHATCYSTFQTECYGPKATEHGDLFEFFETVIKFQRTLPTFKWLSKADIKPSNKTAYTLSKIQKALTKEFSLVPFLGCSGPRYNETEAGKGSKDNGRTVLSEVWYYYHVYGRPQEAQAKKLAADASGGSLSTCAKAKDAVWYYERSKGSEQ